MVASDTDDVEVHDVQYNGVSNPPARVRPRPAYGKRATTAESDLSELSQLSSDEHEDFHPHSPAVNGAGASPLRSQSPRLPTAENAGMFASTPRPTRKRPRAGDASEAEGSTTGDEPIMTEDERITGASPSATQTDELIVRRKRVRH